MQRIRTSMKTASEKILDFIFPRICEGCGEVGSYLCKDCMLKKIEFIEEQKCHVCKEKLLPVSIEKNEMVHPKCQSMTNLNGVFVIAKYSDFIESYIGDIKYEFYYSMVDDLVKAMDLILEGNSVFQRISKKSIITFVPLNPWRRRWRGFNQSELLARELSKLWNVECVRVLKRVRNTKKQVGLKRNERLRNLKGAFAMEGDIGLGVDSVILVDDVMTSGATLEECAEILKKYQIENVYGLVFARG